MLAFEERCGVRSAMRSVGDLFQVEPEQWGLRGDRYLWRDLRERLASVELPSTTSELQRLLENAFWDATSESLTFCGEFKIERFAHGGMSSGYISGDFWRQKGFPLILERYLAAGNWGSDRGVEHGRI